MCEAKGRITPARELDHIIALVNGGTNDEDNFQGLCRPCHVEKTAADLGRIYKRPIGLDGWPVG
jgi:5-methylcytosine-specific restriction protein A